VQFHFAPLLPLWSNFASNLIVKSTSVVTVE
jgi:hypothetical protein